MRNLLWLSSVMCSLGGLAEGQTPSRELQKSQFQKTPMTKPSEQLAQAEVDRPIPPPTKKDRGPEAEESTTTRGVVKSFHENSKGDVDGLTLEDGKDVRFPPHLGKKVSGMVVKGDEVLIVGKMHTGPKGDIHLRAESIKNIKSGVLVEIAPQQEKGGLPHEQMLTEIRAIRVLIEGESQGVQQVSDQKPSGPPHEQVLLELRDLRKYLESRPATRK